MNLLTLIIASAGMSLGLVGPDHDHSNHQGMDKDQGAMKEHATHDGMNHSNPLPKIDRALYAQADWPAHNMAKKLGAKSFQGKELPVALGNETWISEKVDLEGKVMVIEFWATWCPPCRKVSPMLSELQEKYEENLAVLAISGMNDPEEDVRAYIKEHEVAYSNLYDSEQTIASKMEVRSIPHSVILSTDGTIRWQGNPLLPEFKEALEQVLASDPLIKAKG